jgi:hypothetical protein
LTSAAAAGTGGGLRGCLEGNQIMSAAEGNLGLVLKATSLEASGKM